MKEIKDRYLSPGEFESYIRDNHGERICLSYFDKTDNVFYACDDDILLSYSPSMKTYLIKINRTAVLYDWDITEKRKHYNPLTQFNPYLDDFTEEVRQTLLTDLWEVLQIKMSSSDVMQMNDKQIRKVYTNLNKLSEEFVYDNLVLHVAVFCGERMKLKLGGGTWEIREDVIYGTKKHTFTTKDGRRFDRDVMDISNIVRIDKTPVFLTPIDKTKVDFVHKIIKNLNEYGKARLNLMIGI